MLDVRYITEILDLVDIREPLYIIYLQKLLDSKYLSHVRYLSDLRFLIDRDNLIDLLCSLLSRKVSSLTSPALVSLYSVLAPDIAFLRHLKPKIENIVHFILNQKNLVSKEHFILSKAIINLFYSAESSKKAVSLIKDLNAFAEKIRNLKQQQEINSEQLKDVLMALNNTNKLPKNDQSQLGGETTLQEIAWNLIHHGLLVEESTLPMLVEALEGDAITCAAGALMLQSSKRLPPNILKDASQRLFHILSNDELSYRLLDPPDYTKIWRLDNLLFETLKILTK